MVSLILTRPTIVNSSSVVPGGVKHGQVPDKAHKRELSHVLGFGKTRAAEAIEAIAEAGRSFAKKAKLEIVVPDETAPVIVKTIARPARTGKAGVGKIFVHDVVNVVKMRTGEQGVRGI